MTTTQSNGFGTKQQKRAFLASLVGTTVEWFDFFIYATAASLVFSTIFFPDLTAGMGLLASFSTLGVAFLARPLGAFVFGHLGDRVGRRTTLIATLTVMGVSTGLIGVLPTWEQVGIWAPIMLTFLRFMQGVAVGGEWGGAVLVSMENAPKKRARFYGSAPQIASPLALVLATSVMYFVTLLPEEQLFSWGWRIPFLAGFVLVVIGMMIRLGVEESSEFKELKETDEIQRNPISTVFKKMPLRVVIGVGLQSSVMVLFYLVTTYMLAMATDRYGLERSESIMLLLVAAAIDVVAIITVGILADRISSWMIFMAGVSFTLLFAFPMFALFGTANGILMTLTFTIALVCGHATVYAVVSSMTFDLFPTEVRYSGVALTSAFAGVAWGATTPIVAAALVPTASDIHWWPLAAMLTLAGVLSLVCGVAARKYIVKADADKKNEDHELSGEVVPDDTPELSTTFARNVQ